jgi:hypothetical protein
MVPEVAVQVEEEIAEEGFALPQMETEGCRSREFRGIQHIAADMTDKVKGEFDRLAGGEGKFLPRFSVEVFPERFERGAVRLGKEEFGGEAEIDDPRVPAAGKQGFDLLAGIERYKDVRLPEQGREEGRDVRQRRGGPQHLPRDAGGMAVALRRLSVTDQRREGFLRQVRGDHRRGDLVDSIPIVLRQAAMGEKKSDLPELPIVWLQHAFMPFQKKKMSPVHDRSCTGTDKVSYRADVDLATYFMNIPAQDYR